MKKDVISGFIWCVVFSIILILAYRLPEDVVAYPSFIGWTGLVFSVAQFVLSLVKWVKAEKPACTPFFKNITEKKRTVIAALLILVYILVFKVVGYFISTFVFMILFTHIMNNNRSKKSWISEGIISIGFTGVIYLAFGVFLGISLPTLL